MEKDYDRILQKVDQGVSEFPNFDEVTYAWFDDEDRYTEGYHIKWERDNKKYQASGCWCTCCPHEIDIFTVLERA